LVKYNEKALHDPKVEIINADGFTFLTWVRRKNWHIFYRKEQNI
jgi:predicted membrane-bound spermidine synthase